jgi:predicted nucleic-acid-binding Zn-ribbon protein
VLSSFISHGRKPINFMRDYESERILLSHTKSKKVLKINFKLSSSLTSGACGYTFS